MFGLYSPFTENELNSQVDDKNNHSLNIHHLNQFGLPI